MKMLESIDQFNDLIHHERVMAVFSADWCPDCRVIEADLPVIETENPDYTFVVIDRDKFIDICQDYNVFGIPSFIAFKDGEEVGRFVSRDRKTKEEINHFIKELPV